nr:transcription repressor OFP7 [Coffea arabica]
MASKSFKLRVSKLVTTTFHSCRSKDASTLPHDPVPTFFRLSPVNPNFLTIDHYTNPPKSSGSSSVTRHVSSAFSSIGCGFASMKPAAIKHSDDGRARSSSQQEFSWEQEEKWHVVAKIYDDKHQTPRRKIYNSCASGDSDQDKKILALPPPPPPSKKKRRGKKKRAPPARLRASTSSAESGLFSSEGGEVILDEEEEESMIETETLISSWRSSSSDDSSSEFNPNLETIRETPLPITRRHKRTSKKKNKKHSTKRGVSRSTTIYRPSSVSSAAENESPARLSVFKKLIPCSVDGKVKESFAIVKKSEDPYEDFKRSMMEMILEKQMFEERDLEQLLQCFLSLNSRHYHGLIIEVFAEIWEAMFCASDDQRSSNRHRRRRGGGGVNSRNTNNLRV